MKFEKLILKYNTKLSNEENIKNLIKCIDTLQESVIEQLTDVLSQLKSIETHQNELDDMLKGLFEDLDTTEDS